MAKVKVFSYTYNHAFRGAQGTKRYEISCPERFLYYSRAIGMLSKLQITQRGVAIP
ncbi:hypothetical protein HUG15_00055 [Salicibibacter cibarius]|uniref:Uncharacterized protein n=1 Tax=Salicibibacter cibarius TaxID=2743000 RepID=A0A7T6YZM7_9BACI|nr:hypothetical protein HUG15_00055 [Salicibibacter cibarius]